jgi:N-acetylglucosaminyldiphosphoundecaprenol N-acetyl-beta-D-mannosaminyltransferase
LYLFDSISLLVTRIDLVSLAQIESIFLEILSTNKPHQILTTNTLYILDSEADEGLQKIVNDACLSVADSVGIVWAAKILNLKIPERIPGIDLALKLCELCEKYNHPIYMLGGKPGVAKKAAIHLVNKYPNLKIGGIQDGYFESDKNAEIIQKIRESKAKFVLVALGMPKQELWIHENLSQLPPAIYIGIGGSFDIWAGILKRAPKFIQSVGLEWVYRLAQEPFRWKRMARLPLFAAKICAKKLSFPSQKI